MEMFKVKFHDFEVEVEFYYNRGNTVCIITDPYSDPDAAWIGYAKKNPKDTYQKSVGQKIALSDAMRDDFSKEFRKIVWDTYLKTYKSLFLEEAKEKMSKMGKEILHQPTYVFGSSQIYTDDWIRKNFLLGSKAL